MKSKSYERERNIWQRMRWRCNSPNARNYDLYGGRGITVCERWATFAAFLEDMGPAPSPRHKLDRKDENLGFFPENCEWATPETQKNPRSTAVKITAFGETLIISQWARRTGLSAGIISKRIFKMGMQPEDALGAGVVQTKDGVVVGRYASSTEAAKQIGGNRAGIFNVLSGGAKTYYGFGWGYETSLPADPADAEDFDATAEAVDRGERARLTRKTRTALGLSRSEFAKHLRFPVGTVRDWELARATTPDLLSTMCGLSASNPKCTDRLIERPSR